MNILAIRLARLGDVILLLPALRSIKQSQPTSRLTLLTGSPCASLAEMCPFIDEVMSVDRIAMRDGPAWKSLRDIKRLVSWVRSQNFDAVIDFHSFRETNLLACLSGAPVRFGLRRHEAAYLDFCFNQPPVDEDKTIHVSEMFQRVANALPGVTSPTSQESPLRIPAEVQQWAESNLPVQPLLALYVDAPVSDRRWPPESFAAVADYAFTKWGASSVVLSNASGTSAALRVLEESRYRGNLKVLSDLTLPQLAATIRWARLLVSNDTGPMHLGPIVGTATLGLFSVGLPDHFRPIGPGNRFLRRLRIADISVESVVQEIDGMWTKAADPDLPR